MIQFIFYYRWFKEEFAIVINKYCFFFFYCSSIQVKWTRTKINLTEIMKNTFKLFIYLIRCFKYNG